MRHKLTSGKKRHVSGPKKVHRRRRRVGASGQIESIAMNGLAVGGGLVAAREASILLGSMFPGLMASPVTTGIGQAVLGGGTAYFSKNGFVRFVGLGAFGMGILTILQGAGIIGAVPGRNLSYQFVNRRQMGDPRLQFIAGPQTRVGSAQSYPNAFPAVAGNAYPNNFSAVAGRRKRAYTS